MSQTKMSFSLRSLFAIASVWGLLLTAMIPFGIPGTLIAAVSGLAITATIILGGHTELNSIARMAIGALLGAYLGIDILGTLIIRNAFQYDHWFGEATNSAVVGGILGTLIGTLLALSRLPREYASLDNEV